MEKLLKTGTKAFEVKTVSFNKEPVLTLGGLTIVPDYTISAVSYTHLDVYKRQVLPLVLQLGYHDIRILAYGHDVVQPDTFYYLRYVSAYQLSTFYDTEL